MTQSNMVDRSSHILWLMLLILGVLLSILSWGYLLFLIPAGLLTDRFGARKVGAVAMTAWSAAGALTGFGASVGMLMGARILVGFGESPTLPVAAAVA